MNAAAPYSGIIRIFDFPGGLHPEEHKTESSGSPIRALPLPKRLYVPMDQHAGHPATPVVSVGQKVAKGELIGRDDDRRGGNVHAPTSGTVVAIEAHPLCHPSGLSGTTVVIDSDGEERWAEHAGLADYRTVSREELLTRIRDAGIVGLGGAGFPTATKLGTRAPVHTLILNGAECEPYITCDDRLMRERADEVVNGGRIMMHILGVERCLIGVEDNKPEAVEALWAAVRAAGDERLHVATVPTKYPSGGQKQLIYLLTGEEVPSGKRSSSIGYVMQNVMTAAAVYRAIIHGEPLISRIVTVTGAGVRLPGNFEVLLGTPVADLLTAAEADPRRYYKLILGGPMMGFTLPDERVPVTKIANCVIAPTKTEIPPPAPERACIRCGLCVDACPASLLPQQLYWFARSEEYAKAEQHNLFDCIECGACAYVCPSNIPLVSYYRAAKSELRAEREERQKAERARLRYEARLARIEREKQEKAEKHKRAAEARKAEMAADPAAQAALAAAMARAKSEAPVATETAVTATPGDAASVAPAAIPPNPAAGQSEAELRKAEVAAAIARAKARKAAAQTPVSAPDSNDGKID